MLHFSLPQVSLSSSLPPAADTPAPPPHQSPIYIQCPFVIVITIIILGLRASNKHGIFVLSSLDSLTQHDEPQFYPFFMCMQFFKNAWLEKYF
jgi:hypothetical protein